MGDSAVTIILRLLAVVGLVLLNGFFVGAEFALVSVRRTRIEQLVNSGSAMARRVQRALSQLDAYIAATQLGITMVSLALGAIGESVISPIFEPLFDRLLPNEGALITSHVVAFVFSFALTTFLTIVFGELVPKNLALQRTEQAALILTAPLNIFLTIFKPIVLFLRWVGNLILRALGLDPNLAHTSVHSVEELELIVHSSREAGLLEEQQEHMVAGVFEFGERRASRVMTPRTELHAVPVTISLADLVDEAANGTHSRLVIFENDLDHVLGVVHAKDVLRTIQYHLEAVAKKEAVPEFEIRDILRKVPFFPESLPLDELMAELRRQRAQVAVMVDEFGGTAGIVTLEDLLEEIVGDVADEFDLAGETVAEQPDGSYLVDGLMAVEEVDERFALGIEEPFYDTIGGYVFGQLGRAAAVGDEVQAPSGRWLRVAELDGLRVARVSILPLHSADPAADGVVEQEHV
ncbi:MAG: hemolysin family protein [Thermomicrobiales bacterium]